MTLPEFVPPSVAKAANPAKADSQFSSIPVAKVAKAAKAGPKVSNLSNFSSAPPSENDIPLAAKLRALGQPIALEVDGEPICWLVSDKEAEARAGVSPCFTADEVEVLASFDEKGMRDLIEIKRVFGGTLEADE